MQTEHAEEGIFRLGDVPLHKGGVLENAQIVYRKIGSLNGAGDNCVILPTYYAGTHRGYASLIGADKPLDPNRYFIVIPNMFGNGVSTSPSHATDAAKRASFPGVGVADNVTCQRLLIEALGVRRVALVAGWSMGAMQAYFWAARYPDMVDAALPICGTARCWPMNAVFIEGVKAALLADPAFAGGRYRSPPIEGLKAFGRVYAGWAYSAQFFREERFRELGYDDLEDFLRGWEDDHLSFDACDLLAMLWTWRHGDIADAVDPPDYRTALRRISAVVLAIPCIEDRYFTFEEAMSELRLVKIGQVRPLNSPYGHCAGAPGRFPRESALIDGAISDLLQQVRPEHVKLQHPPCM